MFLLEIFDLLRVRNVIRLKNSPHHPLVTVGI